MKKRAGATAIIKSLLNYGLIYQDQNGLYRVSANCEHMLRGNFVLMIPLRVQTGLLLSLLYSL